MIEYRAIYIGDIRFDKSLIFKRVGNYYHCITDESIFYDRELVEDKKDADWLVFKVNKRSKDPLSWKIVKIK